MTKTAYSRSRRTATPPVEPRCEKPPALDPIVCPYAFELQIAGTVVATACRCVVCR